MTSQINLPKNVDLAKHVVSTEQAYNELKIKRGVIGWFFGTGEEKSGNIAGFLLFLCVAGLALIGLALPELIKDNARDVVTAIFSLITLILGYIFGKKTSE
jgi:uncharacterized membrane protein YwzB